MSLSDRHNRNPDRGSHLRLVHDHTPRLAAARTAPSTARQRIEIVPLPEPPENVVAPVSGVATAPRLAPPMPVRGDRRRPDAEHLAKGGAHARLICPACGLGARIDLVDLRTRRVHLSCDRCYRMWQEQIRAGDAARLSRRR